MIHTHFADRVLELVTAKIPSLDTTGKCYLGFSTTAPNTDGYNFTEPSAVDYPSYERIQLSISEALEWTDKWGDVNHGVVSNSEEFTSRECLEEGGWPPFTHFGLFEYKIGGLPMVSDLLRDPDGAVDPETGLYPEKALVVGLNKVAVFRAGTLQLTLR